jgi:hypothetical protein
MTQSTSFRIRAACVIACLAVLFTSTGAFAQTRPDLGTASTYAVFTGGGAINVNTGDTAVLTGDVGQDGSYAFNGFPPSTYTGTLNRDNAAAAQALSDLETAQTVDASVACGTVLGTTIVNGQSFTPGVYCAGAATTTNAASTITFNAQGNGSAIFIVKIDGALSVAAGTHIVLANNARAANIYWFVNGEVTVADSSIFTGTIIADGEISFAGKSSLNGRALASPAGAINLADNRMSIPTDSGTVNNLTIVKPAAGDSILSGTLHDTIKWTGTGIATIKTLQYSLDSGVTWTTIATINNDSFVYLWNVPDTTSTKVLVRVTDTNNLSGLSGIFKIISNKIAIVNPAAGALITEGTLRDTITWTGTGLTATKTFAYSLDSGVTWITIGKDTTNGFTYIWNVPDTVSSKAMIRITDSNGITGKSGIFTIRSSGITVITPASGALVTEGTQGYEVTWSGTGLTSKKTIALSLDSGATWTTIGTITANVFSYEWFVPDTVSTRAMIRITDSNGVTGMSGVFTIRSNGITVTRPVAGEVIAGGTQDFQINWTGTGLTMLKTFALSVDGGKTWVAIGTQSSNAFTYFWNVPDTSTISAIIRITDSNGITGMSGIFTIQSAKIIVVVNPARGVVIASGLQNYQITWTGTGLTAPETLQLSLNGGETWSTIGTTTGNVFTYSWNVPNDTSTDAIIRITDADGITGESGIFSIKSNVGSLVITNPKAGASIAGGTLNYQITFTATGNVTEEKTLEYSLDGGLNWVLIGVMNSDAESYSWDEVPNTATTQALIRIQDSNGVTGISGLFTITVAPNVGSINVVTLSGLDSNRNIGNNKTLGISWTFTLPIGTSVDVEYSLDSLSAWKLIATVPVTGDGGPELPNSTTWQTIASGYYNPVYIRVVSTSDSDIRRIATAFSIVPVPPASVVSDAAISGYSVSNYPNPASEQTTINFELPVRSDVTLIVSDNLGRQVSETSQTFDAGEHNIPFNTSQLANGVYTYTLLAGSIRLNGRMSVIQ